MEGQFQFGQRIDMGSRMLALIVDYALAGTGHDTAKAFPVLLPVGRPSRSASQFPVAASAGRSMPVAIPIPCNM
ncbi:hypothetical protein D3C71_1713660 [compost metagenome]